MPDDPHNRHVGKVQSSHNDGGDMLHAVLFTNGDIGTYTADELISTNSKAKAAERY
jgi:hypothetical protein